MADEVKKVIISVGTDTSGAQQGLEQLKTKMGEVASVPMDPSVKSLKQELREATLEAQKIQQQFGQNSDQFRQAATRVGEIREEFNKFRQTAAAFDPANKFQAFIGLAGGVTTAIRGAYGAMNLLGVETSKAIVILERLEAMRAFSEGIESITRVKNSISAFANVVKSSTVVVKAQEIATKTAAVVMNLFGVAAEEAGVGMKVLQGAIMGLGIGLVVAAVALLVNKFKDWREEQEKAREEQELMNKALDSPEVKDAVVNVGKMTESIKLAKEGFISKKEVVDEYNSTIGKTIGQVKDLDGAEKALTKNGEAYIKMTLLKAAANQALQEASAKVLEIEKKANTGETDDLVHGDKNGQLEEEAKKTEEFIKLKNEADKALFEGNTKLRKELVDQEDQFIKDYARERLDPDLTQQKNHLTEIANKLNEEAANIARTHKFSFNGHYGDGDTKTNKPDQYKQDQARILEQYKELDRINRDAQNKQREALMDARTKELTDLDFSYSEELVKLKDFRDKEHAFNKKYAKSDADLKHDNAVSDEHYRIAEENLLKETNERKLAIQKKYEEQFQKFVGSFQVDAYQKQREDLKVKFEDEMKLYKGYYYKQLILASLYQKELNKINQSEANDKQGKKDDADVSQANFENRRKPNDTLQDLLREEENKFQALQKKKKNQYLQQRALLKENSEEIRKLDNDYYAQAEDDAQEHQQKMSSINDAEVQGKWQVAEEYSQAFQNIAGLFDQSTAIAKVAALSGIAIDTAEAISALTKSSEQNPANGQTAGTAGALQFAAGIVRITANIAKAKQVLDSVHTRGGGGSTVGGVSLPATAPSLNTSLLQQQAIQDVRVVNHQDQVVKAFITDRDLKNHQQKSDFLNKMSTI